MTDELRHSLAGARCHAARVFRWRASLRCLLSAALLLTTLLVSSRGYAYPQYIGRGDANCSDCHYSPTGGGLTNAWGRERRPATLDDPFGDNQDWFGHSDASGFGADQSPEFDVDLGGDARLLSLLSFGDSPRSTAFIPMLVELGGVAAYGNWQLYGTVTPRKGVGDGPAYLAFSREHWLKYQLAKTLSLRAGRLVLPFGIRTPDHTQYVREDFGFDKYDQSYALEFDVTRNDLKLAAAAFAGDLVYQVPDLREAGGALRVGYLLANRFELGLSGLVGRAPARNRVAGGVYTRLNPFGTGYLLGEVAMQKFDFQRSDDTLSTTAAFGRVGWFVTPAVDVYVEAGWRTLSDTSDFDKLRYAVGANWQLLEWFEFLPQLMAERQEEVGTQYFAMGQLHLIY